MKVKTEGEKRDQITNGFGTGPAPEPSPLEGWKCTVKNILMYTAKDKALLTEERLEERINGLTKEINRSNTLVVGSTPSMAWLLIS